MSTKTRRTGSKSADNTARGAPRLSPYTKIGLSGLTLGSMTLSSAALAQQAPASNDATTPPPSKNATAPSSDQLQEVVITGIRASLQRSMQIKQNAMGVVDAISAEDIGQFPDASVGEAIERIPGVTVDRGTINQNSSAGAPTSTGRVTGITVRGFGTQFNELLVEGRPIASGNGQSFDFGVLGANYIAQVDVHKTPDYSLSSGAIGATINVKFPNPLDHPGPQAQAFVSTTTFENDGGFRPAFGALLSDTFADGKLGLLASFDYTDYHILGHHQDIVGWKGTSGNPTSGYLACSSYAVAPAGSGCASVGPGATGNSLAPSWYPQDMAMYLERTDSRRTDGRAALQWHPTDAVLVTLDYNYSADDEHTDRFQRSTWFGAFPNAVQDANGTITNFDYSGPTDFNSFVATDYITSSTPGVNVLWEASDHLSAELDASQSMSKLNPNDGYTDIDADVGYGPNTAVGTNAYTGGLVLNQNSNVVPYWSAVGPNAVAGPAGSLPVISSNYNGLNPFIIGSHVLPLQSQRNSDKVNQIKLMGTWHTDTTEVKLGAQFVDDSWNEYELDTFDFTGSNNYWQLWSGYGPASNNFMYYCSGAPPYQPSNACANQTNPPAGAVAVTHGVPLPPALFKATNVAPWISGYSGGGNLPSSLLIYSPYAVLNYLITQPPNQDWNPTSGYPRYTPGSYPTLGLNAGGVQIVDRQTYSPFLTAQHDFNLGGMTLKANVGLRYERTNSTIGGYAKPVVSVGLQPGDVTAYAFNLGPATLTQATNDYNYFLPSLDLNLLVRPDLKVRADFSRTETPTTNTNIIPNTTYGGRVNALTATGNNPYLLPYLSDNYDLGAEWYYGSNDYVSVDGFFKHVTQFPVSSVQSVTLPIIDPSPLSAGYGHPMVFAETSFTNGEAANVTGVEGIWQQMLMWGFGYQVNGTYAHTNKNFDNHSLTSNQFALPGVGPSANIIAFYQANGLQARLAIQWQGSYLLSDSGQEQSGGAFGNEPVYVASATEVDFSTQYDVTDHFNVYFEALNLTDSVYHTYGRFTNQTLNLVDYGRSYTIGVRAKF